MQFKTFQLSPCSDYIAPQIRRQYIEIRLLRIMSCEYCSTPVVCMEDVGHVHRSTQTHRFHWNYNAVHIRQKIVSS